MEKEGDNLENEIEKARRNIKTDAYSMSIGEILNKISNNEIILNPKFQRYFRWTNKQQSDLVESIFINIPIPPIFIFTRDDGKWDIADGLQRLNTINNFSKNELELYKETEASYIKYLKSKKYNDLPEKLKLLFKNKRIDVVLLLNESSPEAKYDMFNRLNTCGSQLSKQEIRNCVIIMTNEKFYDWLEGLEKDLIFKKLVINRLTETKTQERVDLDLILRFLSFRYINGDINKINSIKSVNEFLDNIILKICEDKNYDYLNNEKAFKKTFELIGSIFKNDAFKRYDIKKNYFVGGFNYAVYEFLVSGIGYYIDYWNDNTIKKIKDTLLNKFIVFCTENKDFQKYSKGGITVETRFKKLISLSKKFFADYE